MKEIQQWYAHKQLQLKQLTDFIYWDLGESGKSLDAVIVIADKFI